MNFIVTHKAPSTSSCFSKKFVIASVGACNIIATLLNSEVSTFTSWLSSPRMMIKFAHSGPSPPFSPTWKVYLYLGAIPCMIFPASVCFGMNVDESWWETFPFSCKFTAKTRKNAFQRICANRFYKYSKEPSSWRYTQDFPKRLQVIDRAEWWLRYLSVVSENTAKMSLAG